MYVCLRTCVHICVCVQAGKEGEAMGRREAPRGYPLGQGKMKTLLPLAQEAEESRAGVPGDR